jgi:hypothetical protein
MMNNTFFSSSYSTGEFCIFEEIQQLSKKWAGVVQYFWAESATFISFMFLNLWLADRKTFQFTPP